MKKQISGVLFLALGGVVGTSADATTFEQYNATNGYSEDGSELAAALLGDTSITLVGGSFGFQGNFSGAGGGSGDQSAGDTIDTMVSSAAVVGDSSEESYSAAFFYDLDLGSIGDTDFVLPDGILLTSGNANLPLENTSSGFTGQASGLGDQGLDDLLASAGYSEQTMDATVLSFDFTVAEGMNAVSLQMIFGSEEYPEFVDSYPEIAAVFVDGVNYAGFSDGSLLTITSNNVGAGNFFDNDIWENGGGDGEGVEGNMAADPSASPLAIEYDGVSAPLTLTGLLDPDLDVHSIKIAVSDTGDQILDTGIFVADLKAVSIDGISDPNDPIMPDPNDPDDGDFDFIIEVGDTGVGIDPNFPIFIDPYVATGYIYEVGNGGAFATVMIPNSYGDGLYNLSIWDGTNFVFQDVLGVNDTYSFLNYDPNGVTKFMIDGIEVTAGIDPSDPTGFVTGVTFVSGGTFNVSQTPISTCDGSPDCAPSSVPEPSALWLLIGGMLGFGGWRRIAKWS